MQLDKTLRQRWKQTDDVWRFETLAGWGQGRATFGGLTAATAVALSHRHLDDSDPPWRLRTANIQFFRASGDGVLEGRFVIHRQGKGTMFAETRLSLAGDDVISVNQVFVRPRSTALSVEARPSRITAPPDDLPELPYIPGVTPEFTQNVAMRWATGGFPFSAGDDPSLTGYCKFRVPAGDAEGLIALLDVWPAPGLSMLSAPAFSSSVMWTAHLLEIPASLDDWCGFEYDTVAAAGGQHTVVGRLYGADKTLLGWTEQLITVFG